MKEKAENSRGRGKYELTQAYKSYADYAFPDKQTRHPRCENTADSVLCTPTNDECKLPNWKCVLRKCTVCCAICSTSKYMQESLNAWSRKQLKIMKDKADNSYGRGKDELTQAYKSYADYAFPDKQTCHPRC